MSSPSNIEAPEQSDETRESWGLTPTSSPTKTSGISDVVENYVFAKVIGRGSFATVYLVKHVKTQKQYAMKVIDKISAHMALLKEQVMREKEALLMVYGVQSFVQLHFSFQDKRRLYFGLGVAKNGSLLKHIDKHGIFDVVATKFYTAELVTCLEYLHKIGIIHRDIKPENILLDERMHIILADFGTSKILHRDKTLTPPNRKEAEVDKKFNEMSLMGTAHYVSPEHLMHRTSRSPADLWALGCIIFELLTGERAFNSNTAFSIFTKIKVLDYKFPDGFSNDSAKSLIQKLLVTDPLKRLGAQDNLKVGYTSLKAHPFFGQLNFGTLYQQEPPPMKVYPPGRDVDTTPEEPYIFPPDLKPGLNNAVLLRLMVDEA